MVVNHEEGLVLRQSMEPSHLRPEIRCIQLKDRSERAKEGGVSDGTYPSRGGVADFSHP